MRCHICDEVLEEDEIKITKKGVINPCRVCLTASQEAYSEFGDADEDEGNSFEEYYEGDLVDLYDEYER